MNKLRLIILLLLALPSALRAQSTIDRVSRAIDELGAYQAQFRVSSQDSFVDGNYQVDGDKFYLYLGGIELYGDGGLRYQIDASNRTVIIDNMPQDQESMLLDNPSNAFDFAHDIYDEILISQKDGQSTILLKAKSADDAVVENIIVIVNNLTSLPESVDYSSQGDSATIYFTEISGISGSVHKFSERNYSDYEIIDFR